MKLPLLVFAVALATRLAAWAYVERQIAADPARDYVIAGDAEGYWDLGTDIAAGREYSVYTPPRRVLRTPGVPAVIATSIAFFGESRTAARGLLAVLAAVGPLMVYGLGWRVGGRKVAVIAGLIAAVSPLAVGLSPVLLSDGLFAALLALQLSIAGPLVGCGPTDDGNAASLRRYILSGLVAAAAVYVRPAWLPAIPVMAICFLLMTPTAKRWTGPLTFVVVFAAAMAPWVIRNATVTGHFVPTSLWLGPTLYDSFGPDADGGSNMTFFDVEAEERIGLSEYEVDHRYRDRALQQIAHDPGRAASLAVAKQARFWSLWPRADEIPSTLIRVAVTVWSVFVFVLAAGGLFKVRSWPAVLLTLGPLLYFALLHVVFVGSMRYRMPAELPLCVLAAVGLVGGQRRTQPASSIDLS